MSCNSSSTLRAFPAGPRACHSAVGPCLKLRFQILPSCSDSHCDTQFNDWKRTLDDLGLLTGCGPLTCMEPSSHSAKNTNDDFSPKISFFIVQKCTPQLGHSLLWALSSVTFSRPTRLAIPSPHPENQMCPFKQNVSYPTAPLCCLICLNSWGNS